MEVVLAIGLVLAGLLITDRLFAAEQRRRGRKDPSGSEALSAAIMDFDGFLNPGRRHQIDEKRRQAMMRDEVTPNDPQFTRIDLDRGIAVIRLPDERNQPTAADPPAAEHPATAEHPANAEHPPTAEHPPAATEPLGIAEPSAGTDPAARMGPAADLPRADGRPGADSG